MFERFTNRARRVLVLAREEARLLNHDFIGAEHLLLGLLHEGEGVAAKALTLSGVRLETAREKLEVTKRPADPATIMSPSFTPRAKRVLELSLRESMQLGCNYIDTEHVLLGLIRAGEGLAVRALHDLGVDLTRLRLTVFGVMAGGGPLANVEVSASGARRAPEPRCPFCSQLLEGGGVADKVLNVWDGGRKQSTQVDVGFVYCTSCGKVIAPQPCSS
jgi:ATP-dependent Clp protease ATP-binding subunit ClpC